ncbi:MAG: FecR domain-containing protein [Leptospirales bacterium]|nr:FecR domain-containing protein [Leptospirales bacterium]
MKQAAWAIAAVAVAFALTACGQKNEQSAGQSGAVKTLVSNMAGQVQIERGGQITAASIGQELTQSDIIITGVDSSADLAIQGFGVVKVGASTRLAIQKLSQDASAAQAELKLERGNVASFINRQNGRDSYAVHTPTAIAGVRGTAFLVSVDGSAARPQVKVAVLDGQVAVQLPGQEEVVIEKNSQIAIDGFQRMTREMVRPLSRDSLDAIKKLAVFQRSNVMEFNALLDEARQATPEIVAMDVGASAEQSVSSRESRDGGLDAVGAARQADLSRTLRRDTQGDPIQLQPNQGYAQQ